MTMQNIHTTLNWEGNELSDFIACMNGNVTHDPRNKKTNSKVTRVLTVKGKKQLCT